MGKIKTIVLDYLETHNDADLEGLTMGDLLADLEGKR